MKFFNLVISVLFTGMVFYCSDDVTSSNDNKTNRTNDLLADSLATTETVNLYRNLKDGISNGVLFGQQDAVAYGIGWWAESGRSDIKSVCGDYPAVYGWDLGDVGQTKNLDGVSFSDMKYWIKEIYARGGVNTISMHLDNPVTGGDAWDNSSAVPSILPGQSHHNSYLQTLDKIAAFLKDLKTSGGTYIPIIFRPYHEHNHTWSWWGSSACTADEYNALWKMTVDYLKDTHNIHHLIYTISPQEIQSQAEYLERYPGDDYVDVLGLDYYRLWDVAYVPELGTTLSLIASLAESKGKISALTEVGLENPYENWWTDFLLPALKYNAQSKKTAWSLIWRNAGTDHHFGPYPGHRSANNFVTFFNDPLTIFQNDLPALYK